VKSGPAQKRETLLRLLAEGMVLVHLDARCDRVQVPTKYALDPELRLNLSYRFASRDLAVGDDGVSCTLSFGGLPFRCVLPYAAIYAVTSHVTGEALVWPEDLPLEAVGARTEQASPPGEPRAEALAEPAAAARASGGEVEEKTPAPATVRPRGHLRLIK
jgi:stringent starvation protein B